MIILGSFFGEPNVINFNQRTFFNVVEIFFMSMCSDMNFTTCFKIKDLYILLLYMSLTKREELSFLKVLAYPNASKIGFTCLIWSSKVPWDTGKRSTGDEAFSRILSCGKPSIPRPIFILALIARVKAASKFGDEMLFWKGNSEK